MALWTIQPVGSGSGRALAECRIISTVTSAGIRYRFLPPVGSRALGTTTSNPPHFHGIPYDGWTWYVGSNTTPPLHPVPGTMWSGMCDRLAREREDEPGTWTAEATGSGIGGKGKKGAKGASKKSVKGTSKKGLKDTKGTSKKGVKGTK